MKPKIDGALMANKIAFCFHFEFAKNCIYGGEEDIPKNLIITLLCTFGPNRQNHRTRVRGGSARDLGHLLRQQNVFFVL